MSELGGAAASSYERCIGFVREAADGFPDPKTGGNTHPTIIDAVMSAFSVFFYQSASWLSCQRAMQGKLGKSNAQTLFGIQHVPTDNHVRNLLDAAPPELLYDAYQKLSPCARSLSLHRTAQRSRITITAG